MIVRTFAAQRVFVDGEVARPGTIPLTRPTTVLQAISQAGGVLYTGKTNDVLVIRRGTENQPLVMVLNLDKVRDGTDLTQDIYLKPFDIVYVPKTTINSVNLWIEQYLTQHGPEDRVHRRLPGGERRHGGRHDEHGHHSGQIAPGGADRHESRKEAA